MAKLEPTRKGGARPGSGAPIGNTNRQKHGLVMLKQAVKGLGGRVIDKRTTLGKSLMKWRADLVADLGGADAISTQQSALVDLAVKSKLLLDSIDAWLLTQKSLVNIRKRSLIPVVMQRQTLADGLARYLGQLGLQRQIKATSVNELLTQSASEKEAVNDYNGNGQGHEHR
jgi:hypothetical protein